MLDSATRLGLALMFWSMGFAANAQCYVKTGTTSCLQEWGGPWQSNYCVDHKCSVGFTCDSPHGEVYNPTQYAQLVDVLEPGIVGEYLGDLDQIWCFAVYEFGECEVIPGGGWCTQSLLWVSYLNDDELWGYCDGGSGGA